MQTRFIEASNHAAGGFNWGKFMVARFTPEEWERKSTFGGRNMLPERGWTPNHLLVVDLQTGEGALFRHGGHASIDLQKHRIRVCDLFQPFLEWLYSQDVSDLEKLPAVLHVRKPASKKQIPEFRPLRSIATKFVEASNDKSGGFNWGKFMVAQLSEKNSRQLLVFDLQTGEGALFRHGGHASSDLNKHRIWVCPLFEQFLERLYKQDVSDLEKLPPVIHVDNPASAFYGYRRAGPQQNRPRTPKSKPRHTKVRGINH